MFQKFFSFLLLLLSIGMLYWCTPISAHDAFYPHHREDFENMTRRRELRGTVLLSTAAFLTVLGVIVYAALRKGRDDNNADESDTKTVQERLTYAANRAASAAQKVLDANGDIAEAATVCLTTYAEACGVTWRQRLYADSQTESLPYQIRCKIGSDVVTFTINTKVVQLKAESSLSKTGLGSQEASKSARATVVLRRSNKEKK